MTACAFLRYRRHAEVAGEKACGTPPKIAPASGPQVTLLGVTSANTPPLPKGDLETINLIPANVMLVTASIRSAI